MPEQTTTFTIGYQGRTIEEFRQVIEQNGIELLIDVRSKPYGRCVDSNREAMEASITDYC